MAEKVKLMCSYGGKINHRPNDRKLFTYVGGHTKILTVDRTITFTHLISKLNNLCEYNNNSDIRLKYKLPGQDLDALISVFDDDDVENMFIEYDLLRQVSVTPPRLRVFVFIPVTVTTPMTARSVNPDFLFGFDKEYSIVSPPENVVQVPEIRAEFSENGLVTRGSYVYTAPVLYGGGGMVTSGYFQAGSVGGGNREQPVVYGMVGLVAGGNREQPVVYNYIPVMPSVVQEQLQQNIPMTGSPLSYDVNGMKGELQFSTAMMSATSHHESNKVVEN